MKTVLIFIGLKLAEIGAVVFVPYWIGKVVCSYTGVDEPLFLVWLMGAIPLVLLAMIFKIASFAIPEIIRANWNKAKELSGRGE